MSGTAVGTVHAVMSALTPAGYVYESDGGAGLNRAGELLERAMLDRGALLGGELAGSRIDPNLRPTTAMFYVDEVPAELVARFWLRRDDADDRCCRACHTPL